MRELGFFLAGCYVIYCWGIVAFYIIATWALFSTTRTAFADRVLYAVKWPLMPIQFPFVMLIMFLCTFGSAAQKAEAAQRLLDMQERFKTKGFYVPKEGNDYRQ